MDMEKPIKVAISLAKSAPQTAKSVSADKRVKTIGYVFISNGMIIAEK